jgi:ABC-2 type transport system ATP-binding protein
VAIIEATGLTKHFGAFVALDGLDLAIDEGEVFGFLGPNGAGKTTTIRLLLGLIRPTAGSARVAGLDPWRDVVATHRLCAYVPGEVGLWPQLTGGETIDLLGRMHGGLDAAHRAVLLDRFDLDPTKKCRSYSKGNRQKVALVAAFAVGAKLLILDEPTSGLDPLMEVAFRETVTEAVAGGATVFLSSHILAEVQQLCARVGILRAGRLVDVSTLDELRRLALVAYDVRYRGAVPAVSGLPGVSQIDDHEPGRIRFSHAGAPAALLACLAAADVVAFEAHEPDLEEIFLRHYRTDDATVAAPGDAQVGAEG